ncbi:MAG: ribosome small subunit-dependent GTPase A [Candidatus Hydrogenedentes bacterium]|nr:ribosome small subunit-dependent GTPase A [Candidatus Hydrogenedentota bacterium]
MAAGKKKKKRTGTRERDWEKQGEFAFSHDRIKHRKAVAKISDAAPQAPLPASFEPNALVIAHSKKWAFVQMAGEELLCKIDDRLVAEDGTLLAAGDRVLMEHLGGEGEDFVRGIAPRRTRLSRPAFGGGREQVIAANVDLLVIVAAVVRPPFRTGLIDRYLISAQVGGVEPLICVNKMDLVDEAPEGLQVYREMGVPIILTSCKTGAGLDELRAALRDRISVLSGHSGVGKSSILNALDPDLELHTREVSDYNDRGKHTTTASRLYQIDDRTRIIDTPGIRGLGLWEVSPAEVSHYFPDIAQYAVACKFRDCTHTHEPGCAVKAAVDTGELSSARLASYLRIRQSLQEEQQRP